jgi:serine/threonine protein kinase
VSRDEVTLDKKLGEGSFGDVWSGTFRGKKVAVKMLSNATHTLGTRSRLAEFMNELAIMRCVCVCVC